MQIKTVWGLWIVLMLLQSCSEPAGPWRGKPAEDHRSGMGLKGNPQSLIEKTWWPEDSAASVESILLMEPDKKTIWKFAPTGQTLEQEEWEANHLQWRYTYKYNSKMQMLASSNFKQEGRPAGHYSIAYNPDGSKQAVQHFTNLGELNRQYRWEYDAFGRMTLSQDFTFLHHADGHRSTVLRETEYLYSDSSAYYTSATESVDGRIERILGYKEGKEINYHGDEDDGWGKTSYDSNGRVLGTEDWAADGSLWKTANFRYDSAGRCIHLWETELGYLRKWEWSIYDEAGMLVEKRSAYPQPGAIFITGEDTLLPMIEIFRNQRDAQGNWVHKATYEEGHLTKLEVREIQYD